MVGICVSYTVPSIKGMIEDMSNNFIVCNRIKKVHCYIEKCYKRLKVSLRYLLYMPSNLEYKQAEWTWDLIALGSRICGGSHSPSKKKIQELASRPYEFVMAPRLLRNRAFRKCEEK